MKLQRVCFCTILLFYHQSESWINYNHNMTEAQWTHSNAILVLELLIYSVLRHWNCSVCSILKPVHFSCMMISNYTLKLTPVYSIFIMSISTCVRLALCSTMLLCLPCCGWPSLLETSVKTFPKTHFRYRRGIGLPRLVPNQPSSGKL